MGMLLNFAGSHNEPRQDRIIPRWVVLFLTRGGEMGMYVITISVYLPVNKLGWARAIP